MGAVNFFIGSRLRCVLTSANVSVDDQNGLSRRTFVRFMTRCGVASGRARCPIPVHEKGMQMKVFARIVAVTFTLATGPVFAKPVTIASPDGHAAISIEDDASRFSVRWRGETVVAASPLGVELDGAPAFSALTLERREDTEVDRNIPLLATNASVARDHYRGAALTFRETGASARKFVIDVRAYDDGVAFRYRIDDPAPVRLKDEKTAFVLPGDPECLVSKVDAAHEALFERLEFSQLSDGVRYDVPLVCMSRSGHASLAIAQAHLEGYAGASLRREGDALRMQLSAVPGRAGPAYVSERSLRSAWRVVMLGDRVGDMIASTLIGNLNPPSEGDFSWWCRARPHGTGGPVRWRA